jgi:hypothetical protein
LDSLAIAHQRGFLSRSPPLASFEWKQGIAIDNPNRLDDKYKDQPPGQLWVPDATKKQRTQFTIPCLLTLPTIGFKIFLSLGSRVMPHALQAAIKQYLASDETELANDNSWGLPPALWPTPPTPQAQAGTPRQNQAAPATMGGGRQGGGHQGQRGDNRHPRIKALMDPYLANNTGWLNITCLLDGANK